MNKFQRLLLNSSFTSQCKHFCTIRRKYPINPEEAKKLPVFDYGVSKSSYRRVFAWGNIQTGALGLLYLRRNEKIDKIEFIKNPKRLSMGEKHEVTTAACGFGFTIYAVNSDTDIKLYGTGLNTDSQIGYHEVRRQKPLGILFYPQPIPLPLKDPTKTRVIKVRAGRAHSAALTDEGLFLLGNNAYGQCGRKIIEDENYTMSNFINHVETVEGKKIVDVECGQDHSLILTEDGAVYSCGWGADGQTGLGHFNTCEKFTRALGDIAQEKIVKLACRSDFVLAINDKGQVFGWGNVEYGQITTENNVQQVSVPTHIKMLEPCGKMRGVASAGSFCVAVNENGQVFTWGYGLLGLGPNVQQSRKPLHIPETLFGKNDFQPYCKVKSVTCGLSYAAAVTNLGDMFIWGRNNLCSLGLGHEKDQYFPYKVSLSGSVQQAFCGVDHTIAICKPFI